MNNNCYIAGKIGDLPESVYKTLFEEGERQVRELYNLTPVSPLNLPHNHGRSWSDYMREDVCALMGCGYLYALNNWRHSIGATIEVELAMKIGINIIYQ